jgi:hypothetical protein
LNAELAKLKMLRGRTPETPESQRKGAFARLAPYRDSAAPDAVSHFFDRRPAGIEWQPAC